MLCIELRYFILLEPLDLLSTALINIFVAIYRRDGHITEPAVERVVGHAVYVSYSSQVWFH